MSFMQKGCFLVLVLFLISFGTAAEQSKNWAQQDVYNKKISDAGFACNNSGLLGLATFEQDSIDGMRRVKYFSQTKESDGTIVWKSAPDIVLEVGGYALQFLHDIDLAYDSFGGAGISISYMGYSIDSSYQFGQSMWVLYFYKPTPESQWVANPEYVFCHEFSRAVGVTIFSNIQLSLAFDSQNNPIIAIKNLRNEVDLEDYEWKQVSTHYLTKKNGEWSAYNLENPYNPILKIGNLLYSSSYYGNPNTYTSVHNIDICRILSTPYYNILWGDIIYWNEGEKIDSRDSKKINVAKCIDNGVENLKTLDFSSYVNGFISKISADSDTSGVYLAFNDSNTIWYNFYNGTIQPPLNVGLNISNNLGELALAKSLPHISLVADDLYMINGPQWPTTKDEWAKVSRSGEYIPANSANKITIKGSSGLSSSKNISVVYETERTDILQKDSVVVASGCSGSTSSTKSFSSFSGSIFTNIIVIAILLNKRRMKN